MAVIVLKIINSALFLNRFERFFLFLRRRKVNYLQNFVDVITVRIDITRKNDINRKIWYQF